MEKNMNQKNNVGNLKPLLKESLVVFKYNKTDGTVRTATGTTCSEYIPEAETPSGNTRYRLSEDVIRYYDVDKEGWRSLRTDNFIEIIGLLDDEGNLIKIEE